MDGKHIAIQNPSGTSKEVFIYNKFYSIVLLAVVDANYKFVWLDISANGAAPEAQIWNTSELILFWLMAGFQFHHLNRYHLTMSQFHTI